MATIIRATDILREYANTIRYRWSAIDGDSERLASTAMIELTSNAPLTKVQVDQLCNDTGWFQKGLGGERL